MGLIIIHFPRMVNMPGISMPAYIVNSMYGLSIYRIIKDLPFAKRIRFNDPAAYAFNLEKFKVTTVDGITMDGVISQIKDFYQAKVSLFSSFYGEPALSRYKQPPNFNGHITSLIPQGYIGIAMDNTAPVFKRHGMAYVDLQKK